jgi:hypothetical protein
MIAVTHRSSQFRRLAAYLLSNRRGMPEGRVAWTAARNLPTDDPELAAEFMHATATQSLAVQKPVYHLMVSFAPTDPVDRAVMERVADRIVDRLGLAEHQAVMVAHRDRPHPHVHVMINRVHPETGRAWSCWMDWPHIHQLRREEENALGLREVPAPCLLRRKGPSLDRARAERAPDEDRATPPHNERPRRGHGARMAQPPKPQNVAALGCDLRAYARVVECGRDLYRAQLDADGARAEGARLEAALDRARNTLASAERALAHAYRDPARAHRAYLGTVVNQGIAEATRLMRERPERFGTLVTTSSRVFGRGRSADEPEGREAVPAAATAVREAADAARALARIVAEAEARRAERAFDHELGLIYRDPAVARTAFARLAGEHGVERAAATLRERPGALGAVRPSISREGSWFEAQLWKAATRGIATAQAQARAEAPPPPAREVHVDPGLSGNSRQADQATSRAQLLETALRALPDRTTLERRLHSACNRLLPREWNRLRLAVTAPQFALALQLRGMARDLVLGREEERAEQAR